MQGSPRTDRDVRPSKPRWRLSGTAAAVLATGLVATVVGAFLANINYDHTEQRLTKLEARLSGLALTGAAADVQLQLVPTARLAAEGVNGAVVQQALTSSARQGGFAGAAIYQVHGGVTQLVASTGSPLSSVMSSPEGMHLISQATTVTTLVVDRYATNSQQSLVYAVGASGQAGVFVAFADQPVPGGKRVRVDPTNPAADIDFAIYFGRTESASALLESNATHLPVGGTRASTTVPFGTAALTLVMSARNSLAGGIAEYSTLLVVLIGLLFTSAVGVLVERAARRREDAEELALENRRLFETQRSVAETFQHALLPKTLPRRTDLEVAFRYVAGTAGLDVGGDWYDMIEVGPSQVFFTVGDVAGRGLEAAILMGSLRGAINAYAAEGDEPDQVLAKLGRLVDVAGDGRFATMICASMDLSTGVLKIVNAGHPRPLLIIAGAAEILEVRPGPPIGVGHSYPITEVSVPPGSILLAYTDGLVERRDETVNEGVERLRRATEHDLPLEQLLDRVLSDLQSVNPAEDDVAMLGIRWIP